MTDRQEAARHGFDADFERERSLGELLEGFDGNRLAAILEGWLGPFRLVDADGTVVLAAGEPEGRACAELGGALDPVGRLETDAEATAGAAAQVLDLLIHAARRYHMAAAMHITTIQADYQALQEKHAELAASEERYRDLAGQLEQRVAEQVATIEDDRRRLYESERLAAVGQLAAGVAHEINNPIGFIGSNLDTAQRYLDELGAVVAAAKGSLPAQRRESVEYTLEDFGELLGESREGVRRIARIVSDLRGISGIDQRADEELDLNDLLRGVCNVGATQLGQLADVELDLEPLPKVRGRIGPLSQAFLNILMNAAQALEGRGTIRIHGRRDRDGVRVEVSDDGVGMPPEVMKRVFEPFYTTRGVGGGTGLGMTVARDTVQAQGGRIELDSAPGRGTTVTVILPAG